MGIDPYHKTLEPISYEEIISTLGDFQQTDLLQVVPLAKSGYTISYSCSMHASTDLSRIYRFRLKPIVTCERNRCLISIKILNTICH
jgi:hypothetical protein